MGLGMRATNLPITCCQQSRHLQYLRNAGPLSVIFMDGNTKQNMLTIIKTLFSLKLLKNSSSKLFKLKEILNKVSV